MTMTRDPISVLFDRMAIRYLERAYDNREHWTGVYLSPPTLEHRLYAMAEGIWDLNSRDEYGEVRWVRGFKRSCYYLLRKYGDYDGLHVGATRAAPTPAVALEWETGDRVYKPGWPSRKWAIRVAIHDRGTAGFDQAVSSASAAGKDWAGVPNMANRDWQQV